MTVIIKGNGIFNDLKDLEYRYDKRSSYGIDNARRLYVIEFSNGLCKVGVSKEPINRIKGIQHTTRILGACILRIFLSEVTTEFYKIEQTVLNRLQRLNGTEFVDNSFETCVKEIRRYVK